MTVTHGLDPARVRAVASQLESQSNRIASVESTGTAALGRLSGAWEGADLENFQASWDSLRPRLDAASGAISSYAVRMREQVEDQVDASEGDGGLGGVGPGAPGGGDSPFRFPDLSAIQDLLGDLGDLASIGVALGTLKYGQFAPRGLLPNGRNGFLGHKAGSPFSRLSWMKRARYYAADSSWIAKGGRAGPQNAVNFARWGRVAKIAGPVGTAASGIFGGINQWNSDLADPSIGDGERGARAVASGLTQGATTAGGALAGAKGGAVIGGMVGGPVGVVVGGLVGGAIGGFATSKAGEWLGGKVADGVSAVGDKLKFW